MADKNTNTELSNAKRVFSVIDETTGEPIMGLYLWNTGCYSPVFDKRTKKLKRHRDGLAEALILLANAAGFSKANNQ